MKHWNLILIAVLAAMVVWKRRAIFEFLISGRVGPKPDLNRSIADPPYLNFSDKLQALSEANKK